MLALVIKSNSCQSLLYKHYKYTNNKLHIIQTKTKQKLFNAPYPTEYHTNHTQKLNTQIYTINKDSRKKEKSLSKLNY